MENKQKRLTRRDFIRGTVGATLAVSTLGIPWASRSEGAVRSSLVTVVRDKNDVDALGLLVLTIPIFFPLAMALDFNPIWFSIIITMATTMGAITPPVGINIYVVKALAPELELAEIFRSVSYFVLACIVCIVILMIFPQIVLIIPEMAGS